MSPSPATTIIGELPDGGWMVGMFILLTGLVSLSIGVVLGLPHLAWYRRRHASI